MGIISLFFALFFVLMVDVNARNVFVLQNVGKSTMGGVSFSIQRSNMEPVIRSSEGLSPEFICVSCLEVSRKMEEVLTDPLIPEKVSVFVNDTCHILPSDLPVKCVEMLEMYANQAVLFLQEYFSEKIFCNSTGLCPVDANILSMSSLGKDSQLSIAFDLFSKSGVSSRFLTTLQMPFFMLQRFTDKISDGRSCDACHAAMDDLRDDLENPEMKIKLLRILLKACENVENHVKECKRMVLEYGPLVLSNLEKYLSNNDLCSMVHLCEASTHHASETMESFHPLIELPTSSDGDVISK